MVVDLAASGGGIRRSPFLGGSGYYVHVCDGGVAAAAVSAVGIEWVLSVYIFST